MVVADRVSQLSDIVAAAGVVDVSEGLELLEASEDVEMMGAIVGLMGEDDLERGLELARMAGATSSGPRKASTVAVSTSSARPWASLPMPQRYRE